MKKVHVSLFTILFCTMLAAQTKVVNLQCENKTNPLGVESKQPRLSWQLESNGRNIKQTAYEIQVGATAADLQKGNKLIWKSGRVTSDQSVYIPYEGNIQSGQPYYWQVRIWDQAGRATAWSEPAHWEMGLLQPTDWKAQWIQADLPPDPQRPSPLLRTTFTTNKAIQSARVYITAHGLYEAFINGQKVGDAYLTPGWTSYNKRLQYQVYDVTSLLKNGHNAIGAMLGSGWYRGVIGFNGNKDAYGNDLSLLCQLDITYTDGSHQLIVTDKNWKSSTGEVKSSEIYNGETIDARDKKKDWATSGYNDNDWKGVVLKEAPKDILIATYNEPIRKHETFSAIKMITTPKGEKVIDFGQNLVGWVQLKVRGKKGDTITLSHAEVLDKEGNFYTENLRAAQQQNHYILSGEGEETFEPHFTFQGFRYVKIDGYPGTLSPDNISAVALYSDMTPTGTFSTSNDLLNQLQHNIQWGQRGNFLDVPTDCPQRDERLGWTGDAQVFSRTASFNMNVHNFFTKWLKDVAADQTEEGKIPFVIPNVLGNDAAGASGWGDVATIIPWNMYLAYGDKKILADQYNSMKEWVDYMDKSSVDGIWTRGNIFGDWLFYRPFDDNDGRSAVTDKSLISQSFFAHSTQLLINAAKVLQKTDDVEKYTSLLNRVKEAFVKEFVTPNGRLVSNTQTAYVLALHFDMLPTNLRTQAAERLAQNVKDYNYHLTTGFLGTPYLCHVLTQYGYDSTAFKLLLQQTYPSWLYPVKMGATTIWERWNGIRPDGTFEPASMNSFNHYAYGAIGDWMYRTVAGLDTDEDQPGYKKIVIKPRIGGDLNYVEANLKTLYGLASSKWKNENEQLTLDVTIPPNTTATVYVPATNAQQVQVDNKPLSQLKGAQVGKAGNQYVPVEIGSGSYQFVVKK